MQGLRMGGSAIEEAVEAAQTKPTGGYKPFLPNIYWDRDQQDKYLLFLTPIEPDEELDLWGSPKLDIIRIFEPKTNMIVAKTDPAIGERTDRFEDVWDATARPTMLSIAVELIPITEEVNGRTKPKGFEIDMREFERRIVDEDGELTEETETVTVPNIGIVAQSPINFYNALKNTNDTEFPIHEVPMKVTRYGENANTYYAFKAYEGQEVDYSNLINYVSEISYLEDTTDALIDRIADLDPQQAALVIGDHILRKRVDELLDPNVYDELFEGITETMDKFGTKRNKAAAKKPARPAAKPSQRKAAKAAPARPAATASNTSDKLAKLREKAQAK